MEDKPKIDLKQHVSPRASKKYLLRIVFYIVFLIIAGIFIFKMSKKKEPEKKVEDVQEIKNIQIEQ